MTTRGVKNEDIRRQYCQMVAQMLAKGGSEAEMAKVVVVEWLEKIAEGEDPKDVILGTTKKDDPHGANKNDLHNRMIAENVLLRVESGMTLAKAVKEVAQWQDAKEDTVSKQYDRYAKKDPILKKRVHALKERSQ